jgi:hypothetical protein
MWCFGVKGEFYATLKIIGRLADALEAEPAEFLMLPAKRVRRAAGEACGPA